MDHPHRGGEDGFTAYQRVSGACMLSDWLDLGSVSCISCHQRARVNFAPPPDAQQAPDGTTRRLKRVTLKRKDFDPEMGGHGWTADCPKCNGAQKCGWSTVQHRNHSFVCVKRIELELAKTQVWQSQLHAAKERIDQFTCNYSEKKLMSGSSGAAGTEQLAEDTPPFAFEPLEVSRMHVDQSNRAPPELLRSERNEPKPIAAPAVLLAAEPAAAREEMEQEPSSSRRRRPRPSRHGS